MIEKLTAKMQFGAGPARRQGVKPNAWTAAEDAIIREHYPRGGSVAALALLPGRTRKGISNRAHGLGVPSHMPRTDWTPAEDALLREHYAAKGAAYVGELVSRSVLSVRNRASHLKVPADLKRAGRQRVKAVKAQQLEPKGRVNLTYSKPKKKATFAPMQGEADTSRAKRTIAPPPADRWAVSGPVPRVVDSGACRDWARAAA